MSEAIDKKFVVMDATLLSSLLTCERKMQLRHGLNIVPNVPKSKPLEMGSLVHIILEHYYKARKLKKNHNDSISIGLEAGEHYFKFGDKIENEVKSPEGIIITPAVYEPVQSIDADDYLMVLDTMDKYFKKYQNDLDPIIHVEHVMGAIIYEDDHLAVQWKAKFDLVTDSAVGFISTDHKTRKQNRKILRTNIQFMGQCVLLKSRNMRVNNIGFQKSLSVDERFTRELKSYTADLLSEFVELAVYYANYLLALEANGYYPPRFTQCDNKFAVCQYHENYCDANPNMRQENVLRFFKPGKPWDVLNDE